MASVSELQGLLKTAQAQLKEKDDYIKAMSESPAQIVLVISTHKNQMLVASLNGGTFASAPLFKNAKPGDFLLQDPTSGGILGQLSEQLRNDLPTAPATVVSVTDTHVELQQQSGDIRVLPKPNFVLEEGARVSLLGGVLVTGMLPTPKIFARQAMAVSWDDIKGQDAGVAVMRELADGAQHRGLFEAYGRQLPKGVLLWGPPGNGKTLMAKALATSMNASLSDGFYTMNGPEALSKWVGEGEAMIRALFQQARDFAATAGRPAVIFIDEADAILRSRAMASGGGVAHTMVPQFLSEMDGIEASGAIVVLATNRPKDLDEAVVREGRVDQKIEVKPPSRALQPEFFEYYLSKRPLADKVTTLAAFATTHAWETPVRSTTVGACLSGASIATAVETAATAAYHRDRAEGRSTPSGITTTDLMHAVAVLKTGLEATR
jgi:ATP-dependent 26S proteasome regulatory subunit